MREARGFHGAVKGAYQYLYLDIRSSLLQRNSRSTFFSFLEAGAGLSAALLPCLEGRSDGILSSASSLTGTFTGLLVRTCRLSLVAKCTLAVCRSLNLPLPPLTLLVPDAFLLCGGLLAESSGITSPEDRGRSFAASRDEGTRDFAPEVAEGRLLLSAALRAFVEVDMVDSNPLTPIILCVS